MLASVRFIPRPLAPGRRQYDPFYKKIEKYENDHHTFQQQQNRVQPPLGAGPGGKTIFKN